MKFIIIIFTTNKLTIVEIEDIRGVRLRKFKLRKIILGVRMHFRHRGNLNWDISFFNVYQNCFEILPTFQYAFFCFFFPVDLGQFISYFVPICSVVIESDLCCISQFFREIQFCCNLIFLCSWIRSLEASTREKL